MTADKATETTSSEPPPTGSIDRRVESAESSQRENVSCAEAAPRNGVLFDTNHLHRDLKGRSVRGGAVTAGTQAVFFVLGLAVTPVLARLLTPADFGLVAMVGAVTAFVTMFRDPGLSMATVQRAEVTHQQVSTLFWLNVGISLVLTIITIALAPAIAWFYGDSRLIWITIVMGGAFIFGGLAVQHLAMLRRNMRFGTLGGIRIAARVVGVTAAITAACLGAGYWALVYMTIAASAATALLAILTSGWRPGPPVRGSGVRPMLAFGANLTGSSFLLRLRISASDILIGSACGAGALGIYSKANKLLMLPVQQIRGPLFSVAVPVLSRLQNQPERFRLYFLKMVEIMGTLGIPMVAFAAVDVENIILTMLGGQWVESIVIFRALIPAALVGTMCAGGGPVFVALGRTDKQLRANTWASIVLLACVATGIVWGTLGVAIAFSISACVTAPATLAYALSGSPVRFREFGLVLWRPATAAMAAASIVLLANYFRVMAAIPLFNLLIDGVLFSVACIACYLSMPGGRHALRESVGLLRSFKR